jgi:hypothetical protein
MSTSRVPGPMGMDNAEPRKPESGLLGSGGLPGPVGNQAEVPLDVSVLEERQGCF